MTEKKQPGRFADDAGELLAAFKHRKDKQPLRKSGERGPITPDKRRPRG